MTQTALPQTSTFHQPTTGTAASPTATCTTCGRGIARQNGGSALWIDAEGKTSCTIKIATTPTILADEVHVRITDDAFRPVELTGSDDNPSVTGRMLVSRAGAELLLADLARALGVTVVTEGQKQDLGLLVRETIADADAQDNNLVDGPSTFALNAHRDRMRDLRDTFRRAGIISG